MLSFAARSPSQAHGETYKGLKVTQFHHFYAYECSVWSMLPERYVSLASTHVPTWYSLYYQK